MALGPKTNTSAPAPMEDVPLLWSASGPLGDGLGSFNFVVLNSPGVVVAMSSLQAYSQNEAFHRKVALEIGACFVLLMSPWVSMKTLGLPRRPKHLSGLGLPRILGGIPGITMSYMCSQNIDETQQPAQRNPKTGPRD